MIYDTVVVGAGFAGMYMLVKLRELGFKAVVLEAASDVGGTWYWNRYPGARCDIESLEYSYSFDDQLQQDWAWSERYAAQQEILDYASHVADRFELRDDINFDVRVTEVHWSGDERVWHIKTESGEFYRARFVITCVGCLSVPNNPLAATEGKFEGLVLHTGKWPKGEVDFGGKKVAVIGTGSSGIQAIPVIARKAKSVVVFQRTPNYSIPAHNRPADRLSVEKYKTRYAYHRDLARRSHIGIASIPQPIKSALEVDPVERNLAFQHAWDHGTTLMTRTFSDLMVDAHANATASDFVRQKIRSIVSDPETAERLTPKFPIGTKRLCLDTGYYDVYNNDRVRLVDLSDSPIEEFRSNGIVAGGEFHEIDILVLATGYDAITGPIEALGIRGEHGKMITEYWADGPRSYLGLMTSGFPNLFTVTGPGSPSILVNVILAIEQHVEFVAKALRFMAEHRFSLVSVPERSEQTWRNEVDKAAQRTLLGGGQSWYTGANIEGKAKVFMPYAGGLGRYREICDEIAASDFQGFEFE